LIGKVLIDNGSTLNIFPRHILKEMIVDELHIRPNTIMAKVYDGLPKHITRLWKWSYMWGHKYS
jgi:hypothetical protein